MRILVGYSGFVGKNLLNQKKFDYLLNSKNIDEIEGLPRNCDLYLSCLPATKWLVNRNTKADQENIENLLSRLSKNRYHNIYLISTIDIYCNSPLGSNEDLLPTFDHPSYGGNRFLFEDKVHHRLSYDNLKIFRLPALYGEHLKKNVIFDVLHDNNVDSINTNSSYQWYDVSDLNSDIEKYENDERMCFNLFPEPLPTPELFRVLKANHTGSHGERVQYDYKTTLSPTGYIYSKEESLQKIKEFVDVFWSK
jgi:hypothetical protein